MRAHRFLLPWTVVLSVLVAFLLTAVTAAIAQNPTAIQIAHRAAQLPSPAPSVEPPSLLRGTFEALEEFSAHNYRTRYFLNTGASRVELQFASNPPQLASGAAVQAQGTRIGNIMLLQSGNGPALQAAVPAPSIPLPGTLGAQSTIVILVNYQDLTIQPYTVADATTAVFTTLNNFIKENSFNQTSLTGDVFGWFTIKVNSSACDFNQIQTLADAAATNAGANLANYKHIIYAAPPVATCSWEGGSTIGGNPSRAWVNVDLRTGILALAHEFGHGLGIMHSHAESCNGTTIGNNCTVQEYGDLFDAMGNTNAMDYNGPQKERLGWQGTSLTKVQSTNTFTLIPYANPASAQGIRILEIPAGNDPATGNPSYYYVCYRQGVGFDSPISLYPSAAKGVLIHHSVPLDLNSTLLLDANPTTAWFNDAALLPGQTFTDSGAGVSITLNSADGTTASVKVTLSGPACTQHNPTVGIAPSNAVLAAGGLAKYNVTITDNDSAVCSSATFGLSATVPQGFTASFIGGSSVNLSPGGSTIKELDVTSPGNAALGGYNVSATATNGAFSGSGNATYTVGNPDFSIGASPSTVNIVQGQFGGTTITLTALGGFNSAVTLSNSPPPSNVIVAYSTNPVPGGAGSVTMSISVGASAPVGAWKITVGASGGGQTHSVDVNLNITAPVIPPPNVNPTLIPQSGFTVVADSEQAAFGANPASPARNAIDGNTGTIWETEYTPVSVPQPHWIRIDLGASYNVVGIKYTPRADGKTRGKIKAVEVYVTDDPNNWGLVAGSGTLLKNANDTRSEVDLLFNGKQGQIVVVRSLSEVKDGDWASAAEINVYQQSTGSCVHVGPQVTLAPKQSQGVQAGTAVTFTISVKNNDTAACSSTTFDVTSSVPQGWSPAVLGKNPPNFTLAPGATGSTTLQVTSPVSAVNGFYTVTGTATSESNSSLTGSDTAQYTVSNISPGDFTLSSSTGSTSVQQNSVSPGITITTAPTGGFNAVVQLSATSQGGGALPAGVTATFNPSSQPAPGGGSSTLTFSATAGATTGTFNITVTASGGGVNHNITISLTVTSLPAGPPSPIPQTNWKLVSADSQETNCANSPATNAFDGKTSTIWESQWCGTIAPMPHIIKVDMGATYSVSAFIYTPRQDLIKRGKIAQYRFLVSTDGVSWTQVASGTLISDPTNSDPVKVAFSATPARFFWLEADVADASGGPFTSVAEITVLGN